MTNNEPEFDKPPFQPVQLCFFYNYSLHEIAFSSSSTDVFFDTPFDMQADPPFRNAFNGEAAGLITAEWIACRKLAENETKHFAVHNADTGKPLTYHFTVVRPAQSQLTNADLLIVSVSRVQDTSKMTSSDKEYADFIALAAHDLDSPLRKLSMLIDRITSKYDNASDNDTRNYIQRARSSLSDMRTMIDNLALLANLGNEPVKKNTCNLDDIVQSSLKELHDLAGDEKILVTVANLPALEGDASQYKKLFGNLLTNAFKFRKKEAPLQLDINCENVPGNDRSSYGLAANLTYVKITVTDNGIGFTQDYAKKIFRPFVRLNGKSEYPGNGIGLALCKKIVENHCGIICAEGKENFGARFIVFLPTSLF